jgi:Flp pilus assembly protein TadG
MTNCKRESGQSLVLVALAMLGLFTLFMVVINATVLITANRALNRAVEDAAVAALRTGVVGNAGINQSLAEAEARRVLRIELANVRMSDTVAAASSSASVTASGSTVNVSATVHVCPLMWACIPMTVVRVSDLETVTFAPPAATLAPPVVIPVPSPTP